MLTKETVLEKIKEYAEKNNGILSSKQNNGCEYLFPSETDYANFLNELSKEGIKIDAKKDEPQKTCII
jgi:hypothetical protein